MSTSFYGDHYSSYFNVSRVRKVSSETSESVTTSTTLATSTSSITSNKSTSAVHKPIEDEELRKLRRLWWEEGNIHPQAKWEEAKLPYVIAKDITLDEYEKRTDEFNVHGLWEWINYEVIIYELPLKRHETFIGSITSEIMEKCLPAKRTDAEIGNLGAIRTRVDNSGKEADACFRPSKPPVQPPNGSDREGEPWPNIVIEVAYSESEQHVLDKVKKYWLGNLDRVHDAIVVKIDPVSTGQIPKRMQAWHFCISDKRHRYRDVPHRTYFEFGTHDKDGNPIDIQQGQCIIKISLDCLYHDKFPDIVIPRQLLPDPIVLDFFLIRESFLLLLEQLICDKTLAD
ncbi:16583_t:CDS:2 [Funneliformis mosseae]|uniref:16583_t:CDS:1 n=1 Tax=Funneliformis mosseae TaxID=27381 RepID=A0A9N9DZF2_FUNMO|nr:16583_t:CDS:2 [Funneliformis mosseae]